jgi:hypothetical protein
MKPAASRKTRVVIRPLRTVAVLLSTLLFVATVCIWIRSYFVSDWVRIMSEHEGPEREVIEDGHPVTHHDSFEREWGMQASRGQIGVSLERRMNMSTDAQPGFNWQPTPPTAMNVSVLAAIAEVFFYRVGFGFVKMTERPEPGTWSITIGVLAPCWFLALVTGVLPAMWLTRWRRSAIAARRRNAGQCAACGYDLRASPERCPECGAAEAAVGAGRVPV